MTKMYMITDMSQLSSIKEHILQRKVDLNPFKGSYLYYTLFHTSSLKNIEGYNTLLRVFKSNHNVLYFDYDDGGFEENYVEDEDEIVPFATGRYSL